VSIPSLTLNLGINFGKTTSLQASEYAEIMRFYYPLLCIVFNTSDTQIDDDTLKVLCAVYSFIGFYNLISSKAHTEITLLQASNFLVEFGMNLEPLETYSKSKFKFPKMHNMNHYFEAVRRKGNVSNTDTQHYESAHKSVKNEYRLGNKKPGYEKHIIKMITVKDALDESIRILSSDQPSISDFLRDEKRATGIKAGGDMYRKRVPLPLEYHAPLGVLLNLEFTAHTVCRLYSAVKVTWRSNGMHISTYRHKID
jgi:hypothetical protein